MHIMMFPSAPGLILVLGPKHVFVIDMNEHNSYALTHEEFVGVVIKVRGERDAGRA